MLSLKIQKLISIVLLMHILKIRSILTLPRHQNQSSVQPHELDADWPIRQIVLRFANSRGVSEWNERELNPNEFLAQTQTQTNNSQFEDDSDPVCGSNLIVLGRYVPGDDAKYVHIPDHRELGKYRHIPFPYDGGYGKYSGFNIPYFYDPSADSR